MHGGEGGCSMGGREEWRKNLIPEGGKYFAFQWTFSTSPILSGDGCLLRLQEAALP